MTQHTEHEYGVRYFDGVEDWQLSVWYGSINSPETRREYKDYYDMQREMAGADPQPLVFLHRKKVISYSEPDVVVDPDPEPEPEEDTAAE